MKRLGLTLGLLTWLLPATGRADGEFSYLPPGDLHPGSGSGLADDTVYAPGMRFPIEDGPAYPNSQVWGHGGGSGPGGSQCDAENYSYPWRDNYCESRSWDMPLCPSGTGHQGQDIRAATCDDRTHWIVSTEDGTVTNVGSYSIYVTTASGQRFDYLHGNDVQVGSGQSVSRGQRLATVSNAFGGSATTIHLHFNIKQDVAGVGLVYVSPYMSLVESYQELMGLDQGSSDGVAGPVEAVTCDAIRGWAQDAENPTTPLEVRVYFGGPADDPDAVGVAIEANEYRDDLCDDLGSCEHGFTLQVPRSLHDGQTHPVHVYARAADGTGLSPIGTGPREIRCDAPTAPKGVLRRVEGPDAMADWEMSPFWDAAPIDASDLADVPEGADWPNRRVVVKADDDDQWWLIDQGKRRAVQGDAAEAWGIVAADVETRPGDEIDAAPIGPPLRADRFVVSADGVTLYVVDEDVCDADDDCEGMVGGGTDGGSDPEGTGGGDTDGPSTAGALPGYDERGDEGCGCRTIAPQRKVILWVVLPLLAGWRRRRR